MEWIGSLCIGVHGITIDTTTHAGAGARHKQNRSWESVTRMPAINPITGGDNQGPLRHLRRGTGTAVRAPHTGYVKTLYRIAVQDY